MNRFEELKLKKPKGSQSQSKDKGPVINALTKDFDFDKVLHELKGHELLNASPSVNKLKWGKFKHQPYYYRPSPIDLQFEDKGVVAYGIGFSGDSIQEWNIDGLTEF